MSDGKLSNKTVVRRTKKNGNRAQNRELRQSMYDLSDRVQVLKVEADKGTPAPHKTLERSSSLPKSTQVTVQPKNSREILKQYVANIHKIDVDKIEEKVQTNNDFNDDDFPIHKAIENDAIKDLSLFLLRNDAQLEQKNFAGQTPLIYAVCAGDIDVVNLLITCGACVNVCDKFGVSPLRYAVEAGDFEIASLLISHGANAETVQNGF